MKRTEKVWGVIDLTSGTMKVAKGAFGVDRNEALADDVVKTEALAERWGDVDA